MRNRPRRYAAIAIVLLVSGACSNGSNPRRTAAPVAHRYARPTSTASTATSAVGATSTEVTVQTDDPVLDRIDGVSFPTTGAGTWGEFRILNQQAGVDVAATDADAGTGSVAYYALPDAGAAQAFAAGLPLHLAGIGDYNGYLPLPAPPDLPAAARAVDLRTCLGTVAPGAAMRPDGTCSDGGRTQSEGAAVVVPSDTFVMVATAWDDGGTSDPAPPEAQDQAAATARAGVTFLTQNGA